MNVRDFLNKAVGKVSSNKTDKKPEPKKPFELPEQLADETLCHLFSYCDAKSLFALALTDRRFADVVHTVREQQKQRRDTFFLNYLEHNQTLSLQSKKDVIKHLEDIYTYLNVNLSSDMHVGRKQAKLAHLLAMLVEIMTYLSTQHLIHFTWNDDMYHHWGIPHAWGASAGKVFAPHDVDNVRKAVHELFWHLANPEVEKLSDDEYSNYANKPLTDPSLLLAFNLLPGYEVQKILSTLQRSEDTPWEAQADPHMITLVQNLASQLQVSILSTAEPSESKLTTANFLSNKNIFSFIGIFANKEQSHENQSKKELDKLSELLLRCTIAILKRCVIREDMLGSSRVAEFSERFEQKM
jgi:hypothetical protein